MFDYRPAPFWFLNHRLDKAELTRQLEIMAGCGVSGFFMHPRAGLLTAYGSDEWFDAIAHIISESRRLGLKAWLYDEDPFPSGMAGGRICFDHPEWAARALSITRHKPDENGRIFARIGTGRLLSAIAIRTVPGTPGIAEQRDAAASVGVIRPEYFKRYINSTYYTGMYGKLDHVHPRAETFYPALWLDMALPAGEGWQVYVTCAETVMSEDKYGILPDCMNRDAVGAFIALTHERYLERLGGGAVPGVFTDEPAAGWGLPWTEGFEEAFEKACGYRIQDNHHHLKSDFGEMSRRVRRDYWRVVTDMYESAFFGQISAWCRKKSMAFTGHVIGEEDPLLQLFTGGNAFRAQRFFDIPGFDVVGKFTATRDHPALNFGGKLISSAAYVFGKKQVACEFLACNAFNFGQAGMLKMAGWLFALGINWLVPHGFYYSIDGDRKFDAGKSFFFQDPGFPDFPRFAAFAANAGRLLGESCYTPSYYLLYPVTAFRSLIPAEHRAAEALRDSLYAACTALFEAHVEFALIDDITLAEMREPGLPVIIPDDSAAAELICLFLPPDAKTVSVEHAVADEAAERTLIDSPAARDILVRRTHTDDGTIAVYLFNNSAAGTVFGLTERPDSHVYGYDAFSDKISDECGSVGHRLEPYSAMILLVSGSGLQPTCRRSDIPRFSDGGHSYDDAPQWEYSPPGGSLCGINKWDAVLTAPDGKVAESRSRDFCLVRDISGTELRYMPPKFPRPSLDGAAVVPSVYPVRAVFTAAFELDAGAAAEPLCLLFEGDTFRGDHTLSLNGAEISRAEYKRRAVYDPSNVTVDITGKTRPGSNTLTVSWAEAGEFDGIRSSLYVIKAPAI